MKPSLRDLAERTWAKRYALLVRGLGGTDRGTPEGLSLASVGPMVHRILDPGDRSHVWIALSVMTGRLPDESVLGAVAMASEFDAGEALGDVFARAADRASLRREVSLADPDDVLLDVTTTLQTPYTTGIQRVVRETVARWVAEHPLARPVVWTSDEAAPRELTERELAHLTGGTGGARVQGSDAGARLVVPWRCTFVVPEVPTSTTRAAAMQALARWSGCRTSAIGYDLVVVTSGETRIDHGSETYYSYLSALQGFTAVAPISGASGAEFGGWAKALDSIGRTGPRLDTVSLPVAIDRADETTRSEVAHVLGTRLPVVLVVGSHEPRKNHLAVLHAAELMWREGREFRLVFVGGRAWGSEDFGRRVSQLAAVRRPVDVFSGVDDEFLAAAYELARFTVFPSFNEGFGLPVGESLAMGTPVITSNFGSMAEIAADGGALTVDPRDDHAIADAMRRLLTDEALLADLVRQARNRPSRTWDDYAAETWSVLVGDGS
ncbi:glycosyltransferase family 4 protein [Nocardioides piscis]|uniref:Glycosyltransferase family 4 protein n=1 Tax=Nocardioides piscis TaxID=2714938 RepID=A0A6G7YGL4_9ACTN|nr:glycosyltransferase family 1 protein [Nocardioides piscis]QIK75955.1 glycosyltransferase family 4 protein [Nocardioides piscis]